MALIKIKMGAKARKKHIIFLFQKYAHRLIIGNEKLNKFNMKAHDRCELCNVATDTQEHIFFECDYNNNLFKSLIQYIVKN